MANPLGERIFRVKKPTLLTASRMVVRVVIVLVIVSPLSALAFSSVIRDDRGKEVCFEKPPERIVCLVPSLTELLFAMGAGNRVAGVTFHDLYPSGATLRPVVGGFFSPSTEKIRSLSPDLLIVADLHHDRIPGWEKICPVVQWNIGSINRAYELTAVLGRLCGCEAQALEVTEASRKDMERIAKIVGRVHMEKRKRVLRLMGRDSLMTPGDDSFQNELIRAAGGIPPKTGKNGAIVSMEPEEFTAFNPQMMYGCGEDRSAESGLLSRPIFKNVDAVKNRAIRFYPCDLTCRASSRMGHFVGSLAADLYPDLFRNSDPNNLRPDLAEEKKLDVGLPSIRKASVRQSAIFDFIHKSLVIECARPQEVMSTLEGFREGVRVLGNHYFPPQTWSMGHDEGLEGLKKRAFSALNLHSETTAFLFTGADMDHLAVKEKSFQFLKVVALVTAGVRGNALRTSKDRGEHVEPGTINIILLTNRRLSRGAMARALVTATEAKTAALQDLDIRSSFSPIDYTATGTGTDNVLVAGGEGKPVENTGGHSKMGELIGTAVYEAVKEAVFMQNGIAEERPVYHRMMERNMSLQSLLHKSSCDCAMDKDDLVAELEHLLLVPRYASFIEGAMALSDAHGNRLVRDLSFFKTMALAMASDIAGKPVTDIPDICAGQGLPVVMEMAFNALIKGTMERLSP